MSHVAECFQTPRLEAERLAPHHLDDLLALHRDPEVMAELGGVRDEEQTRQYLARNLEHWAEHGFGVWMLREKERPEVVGRAILRFLPLHGVQEVEVGFALYSRLWGRGLATEVGGVCVKMAWEELGVETLVGVTTPTNAASQRVLQRLGLSYEEEVVFDGAPYRVYRAARPADHRPRYS